MWIKNKILFTKLLCLLSAFCLVSWFIMYFSPVSLRSYAAGSSGGSSSSNYVILTPAQTLALYGTQIQGLLRQTYNSAPITISFDFAFPLNTVGYMDSGGGFDGTQVYNAVQPTVAKDELSSYFGSCNGLVYIASSSQWGGTDITPYNHQGGSNIPVQLHCPFSISLDDIGGITQGILWSTCPANWYAYTSPFDKYVSTWLFSDSNLTINAIRGNTYSGWQRPAVLLLPTYQYYNSATLDETQTQYFSGFYINTEEQPDSFDMTGVTIDVYSVTNASSGTDLWLIVTCPTLWAYTPPVVTTNETIPTATFPTATFPTSTTYDPLKIINDNSNTIISQLNTIIGQLNAIYNRMVSQGQVPVDLVPADQLHTLPTDVELQLHQAIQGFTTSRLPDAGNGYEFYSSLYSYFTTNRLSFFGVFGGFSLALTVVCWFIFRGRH